MGLGSAIELVCLHILRLGHTFVLVCATALLIMSQAVAGTDDPCNNVLTLAAEQGEPEDALALLGGCLASRAPEDTLRRVALEMARQSLRMNDVAATRRYLDILAEMLDFEQDSESPEVSGK